MTAPDPSSTAASAAPLVELRGATVGYPDKPILRGVDLEVRRGDFLAIIGPNGAGKTTVLRTFLGVLPPLAGTCVARGRLGYAPQRSSLDPVFPFTSAEVVAMGLLGGEQPGTARAAELVTRALAACGMGAQADTPFRDLSGGQKQRVLVARALVSEPDVLVLDEPTNDLDLRGEHDVMELVRSLHEGGRTVVMVSHLLHVVARYAKRMAFIREGTLVTGDTDGMLTPEKLEPLYGMPVVVGEVAGHKAVAPGVGPVKPPEPTPAPSESARAERPSAEREPGHGLDDSRAGKESRRAAARARREAAREAHEAEKRAEAERRAAAALAPKEPDAPATAAPVSLPETRAAWARAAMNPGPWPWAALVLTGLSLFAAWRVGREVDAREAVERQLAEEAERHLAASKASSEREVDLGYRLSLAQTHGNALADQERALQEQLARLKAEAADAAKALGQAEAARDAAALERDSRMAGLAKLEAQLAEVTSRALAADRERASLEKQVAAAKADKDAGETLLAATRQRIAELEGKAVELEAEKAELEAEAKEAAAREAALHTQLADARTAVDEVRRAAQGMERTLESANEVRELLGASRVEVAADRPTSLALRAADSLARAGRGECVLAFVVDGGAPGLELSLVAGDRAFPLVGQPVGPSSARWYVVVPAVAGELAGASELTLRVASREPLTLTSVRLLATRLPAEPADLLEQLQRARAPKPEQPPGGRGF